MTPFLSDPDVTIYNGDALDVLRELPDESVDCAATSPPFYGLRDYGVKGQIGLEGSQREWVWTLSGVFEEVRRVLKPTGTLWIECGDSYVHGQGGRQSAVGELPSTMRFDRKEAGSSRPGLPSSFGERDVGPRFYPGRDSGLKPKDLLLSPFKLAETLQHDGWWLRQVIVWHKPNAMPESVTDRCTTAHSYVFLFSKSARYCFDAEAISEPAEWARWGDQTVPKYEGTETSTGWMQPKSKHELTNIARGNSTGREANGVDKRFAVRADRADGRKNARSVWTIPTEGYPEAHFATWPQALVERILKAGCPEGGTVLDPFFGSGTTGMVARRLGRKCVGIDLNASYCELAAKRLAQLSLLAEGAG